MTTQLPENNEIHPFLAYLEGLKSPQLVTDLYTVPSISLLTYRFLPSLAQFVINRLLLVKGSVQFTEIRAWFRPESKTMQNRVLYRLKQLYILQGRGQEVWMNTAMQRALQTAFSCPLQSFRINKEDSKSKRLDDAFLDDFARRHWENVLYLLVSGSGDNRPTDKKSKSSPSFLEELLLKSALLTETRQVSNSGFQFLLKDTSAQIWQLLVEFIKFKSSDDPSMLAWILEFIAEMVLMAKAGKSYQLKIDSEKSKFLQNLKDFGLIQLSADQSIIPSRLFISLTASKNALDFSMTDNHGSSTPQGFLIVETNYRIYAYTSSPLQIAILAMFVRLQDRFPNMVYGQLTRESVQRALSHGITADQIIHYLQVNAHPIMHVRHAQDQQSTRPGSGYKSSSIIPFTIGDQVRLWELDRKRLATRPGYLYQQFMTADEYEAVVKEARATDALLYANSQMRMLIVSEEGHLRVKDFIKKAK